MQSDINLPDGKDPGGSPPETLPPEGSPPIKTPETDIIDGSDHPSQDSAVDGTKSSPVQLQGQGKEDNHYQDFLDNKEIDWLLCSQDSPVYKTIAKLPLNLLLVKPDWQPYRMEIWLPEVPKPMENITHANRWCQSLHAMDDYLRKSYKDRGLIDNDDYILKNKKHMIELMVSSHQKLDEETKWNDPQYLLTKYEVEALVRITCAFRFNHQLNKLEKRPSENLVKYWCEWVEIIEEVRENQKKLLEENKDLDASIMDIDQTQEESQKPITVTKEIREMFKLRREKKQRSPEKAKANEKMKHQIEEMKKNIKKENPEEDDERKSRTSEQEEQIDTSRKKSKSRLDRARNRRKKKDPDYKLPSKKQRIEEDISKEQEKIKERGGQIQRSFKIDKARPRELTQDEMEKVEERFKMDRTSYPNMFQPRGYHGSLGKDWGAPIDFNKEFEECKRPKIQQEMIPKEDAIRAARKQGMAMEGMDEIFLKGYPDQRTDTGEGSYNRFDEAIPDDQFRQMLTNVGVTDLDDTGRPILTQTQFKKLLKGNTGILEIQGEDGQLLKLRPKSTYDYNLKLCRPQGKPNEIFECHDNFILPGSRLTNKIRGILECEGLEILQEKLDTLHKNSIIQEVVVKNNLGQTRVQFMYKLGTATMESWNNDDILYFVSVCHSSGVNTHLMQELLMKATNICIPHMYGCCILGLDCKMNHETRYHCLLVKYKNERESMQYVAKGAEDYTEAHEQANRHKTLVWNLANEYAAAGVSNLAMQIANRLRIDPKHKEPKKEFDYQLKLCQVGTAVIRQYMMGHLTALSSESTNWIVASVLKQFLSPPKQDWVDKMNQSQKVKRDKKDREINESFKKYLKNNPKTQIKSEKDVFLQIPQQLKFTCVASHSLTDQTLQQNWCMNTYMERLQHDKNQVGDEAFSLAITYDLSETNAVEFDDSWIYLKTYSNDSCRIMNPSTGQKELPGDVPTECIWSATSLQNLKAQMKDIQDLRWGVRVKSMTTQQMNHLMREEMLLVDQYEDPKGAREQLQLDKSDEQFYCILNYQALFAQRKLFFNENKPMTNEQLVCPFKCLLQRDLDFNKLTRQEKNMMKHQRYIAWRLEINDGARDALDQVQGEGFKDYLAVHKINEKVYNEFKKDLIRSQEDVKTAIKSGQRVTDQMGGPRELYGAFLTREQEMNRRKEARKNRKINQDFGVAMSEVHERIKKWSGDKRKKEYEKLILTVVDPSKKDSIEAIQTMVKEIDGPEAYKDIMDLSEEIDKDPPDEGDNGPKAPLSKDSSVAQ